MQGIRTGYLLEEDVAALDRPAPSTGVRLILNKDAFLQAWDRDVLFRDSGHRSAVFPTLGGPGVVLHEAVPAGTWRGAAEGNRYELTVALFTTLLEAVRRDVEDEAQRVARARGRQTATVAQIAVG